MPDQPPSTPAPSAPAPAPAKTGNRVLIIIVCIVFGFVLLVGGCVSACFYFGAKKAKEFSRSAQKNPVYLSLSIAASLNPDVEVISKDEASGKITVKNKRTGELVTINSNDYSKDTIDQAMEKMTEGLRAAAAKSRIAAAAATESPASSSASPGPEVEASAAAPRISAGKAGAMSAILKKFPDYIPAYPGSETVEATQNSVGALRTGTYSFNTSDKLDAVVEFYEKKATASGFSVMSRNGDSNDFGPTATLSLLHADPQGTMTIAAESKDAGRVHVTITVTELGK